MVDMFGARFASVNVWCAVGELAEISKSLHCSCRLERRYVSSFHCISARCVQLTGPAGSWKAVYVTLTNPLHNSLFMNVLTEFG